MDSCSLLTPDVRKLPPANVPSFLFLFLLCYLSPPPFLPLFFDTVCFPLSPSLSDIWLSCRLFRSPGFEFSVLYLLLSFLKVNCSPRCCFSACERGEVPPDYLEMIKVAEHLHLFPLAACMSALAPEACVCICLLDVTTPLRVGDCFYSHSELHPTCV